jgi:tetratricopeptide (TPR) repeat protein
LINFKTAWQILIAEILILFIFGFKEKIRIDFVSVLMILLICSIFFYLFPVPLPGFPRLPPEISLSFPAEIYILKGAFTKNLKNLFLGTGPSTFVFDYSLYRSPLLNQTVFWGTRFSKGHSLFLDWILTKGIFGGMVLFSLYLFSLISIFSYFGKLREGDEFFEIKLNLSAALLGSILASFFYPFNFSLFFIFWFLLGGLFFSLSQKIIKIDLSSTGRNLLINAIFIFSIVLSFSLIFLQGGKYLAEVNYLKGIKFSQAGNFDLAISYLQKAINLNPSLDIYWRDLSQIFLTKANLISQDPKLTNEEKRNLANSAIIEGARAINRAVTIFPQNVANWNVRGFFFQNLVGIEGAAQESLNSYQMSIQLEPNSPYPYTEKGRVYILLAQDFAKKNDEKSQKENLNFAISILKRALELKSDYAPAHYLLAVAYDQLGEADLAISKLEEAKAFAPQDFGLAFQLGVLYWRKDEIEKAKGEFERAINLNPDYSNAHYMLGLVFEKMGEREKAISEFEKVAKLNPENEEVKKILENLKKGLPPLEGVTPQIRERPPEIK